MKTGGSHHELHHGVALADDPRADTVQNVSACAMGTELHCRAAAAHHQTFHKAYKSVVSRQEYLVHPTSITEVWRVGVHCCWSHSLKQLTTRHPDINQHPSFQEKTFHSLNFTTFHIIMLLLFLG